MKQTLTKYVHWDFGRECQEKLKRILAGFDLKKEGVEVSYENQKWFGEIHTMATLRAKDTESAIPVFTEIYQRLYDYTNTAAFLNGTELLELAHQIDGSGGRVNI